MSSEQLRWLVDRALIGDLLIEFARRLDLRGWDGYSELYTVDGELELLGPTIARGRAEISEFAARSLGRYEATWHLSAAHTIDIDGDTARTRSSLFAVHVLGDHGRSHADGAGWYDNTS
ncbi:hypothetical protein ALI22I_05160 [Saccharothrix sp. ALI-22-I]|uniref:nuclear transport factor 2 family protein n=1 Tax=Saccharothrix sp. ALI-22-I TaxID=1933778 RepID=UPI00097C6FC9|nr:nuclear transport factor 2 family protein [Saccharothrix sp. ALI-22-I]ONI92185.1 hypothetical protein ALI22I_05160 [Saccharothrix sp. ALI-22-I]